MAALDELEQVTREVAASVGPSIVGIGGGRGQGSGVVVGKGLVLTNAHNAWGGEPTVAFADGRVTTGRVVGADVDGDVAVLAADTGDAPALPWGEEAPAAGALVWAAANPGGRGLRVTFGLVSAAHQAFRGPRGRRITGSLEHTAPLSKGSSGSAVVDRSGHLVGLNTHRLGDGFYLALPTDADLRARVDALGRGESPSRPRLGVGLAPEGVARRLRRSVGLDERDGLLVRLVEDASPADRAGVRPGDLIVAAGERPTPTLDSLHEAIDALVEGAALELRLVRGVEELSVTVTLADSGDEGDG